MKTSLVIGLSAALDVVAAAVLVLLGYWVFALVMLGVAVAGAAVAIVMWQNGR